MNRIEDLITALQKKEEETKIRYYGYWQLLVQ